jgi:hypothetical protein
MNDPIVDEVRRVRDAYAPRFNSDLNAIFRDIRDKAKTSGRTFVSFTPDRLQPGQVLRPTESAVPVSDSIPSHQVGSTVEG